MKNLVVGLLAIVSLTFVRCSEDEPVDIRLAAVGEYTGTLKYYVLDGTTLVDLNDDESVEFTVSKGSADGTIVVNVEGDNITGTKVAAASNGFSFDINSFTSDGYSCSGYQGVTLGTVKYHGRFESNSERLTLFFQFVDDGITFVVRVQGDI